MKHGRPEWIHEFSPLHPVQGWRRCHSQLVWNAIQAALLAACFREAVKRDEQGDAWLVWFRGCERAGWDVEP